MTYEEMKKDLPQMIARMALFMEVDLSSDEVEKIAKIAEFKNMKGDDTANLSWLKMFENKEGKSMFMRKGTVGDWKNFLSAEQSAQIDELYAKKISPNSDFKFDYE